MLTDNASLSTQLQPASRPRVPSVSATARRWWRAVWPPVLALALIFGAWEGIALLLTNGLEEGTFDYRQKQSLLPAPVKVVQAFFANSDSFLNAARITLFNAFIGFVIGAVIGFGLALLMAQYLWVERSFYLYIVASQMIPVIALAPVLYGIIKEESALKITVAAYLTFFPVTVSVLKGLRSLNSGSLDLMTTYAASRWAVYTKLRIPSALPFLFTALKIASTGSLIGAIVSELMGGSSGLGVLIVQLQYTSFAATDKLWALIIEIAIIGVLFFLAVTLVERRVVHWQPEYRKR